MLFLLLLASIGLWFSANGTTISRPHAAAVTGPVSTTVHDPIASTKSASDAPAVCTAHPAPNGHSELAALALADHDFRPDYRHAVPNGVTNKYSRPNRHTRPDGGPYPGSNALAVAPT